MPPAPTSVTALTDAESSYLQSQLEAYRATPSPEKDAFRQRCVKHIISERGLEEDPYKLELLHSVSVRSPPIISLYRAIL